VGQSFDFDSRMGQKFQPSCVLIRLMVDNALDAALQNQFATLFARRQGDVQSAIFGIVGGAGNFQYRIGLSVQDIPMGLALLIFAGIWESTRGAIVAIADDHAVFDQQCAHLFSRTMRKRGPFDGHFHVCSIVPALFFDHNKS
jgi:hypothetical protein